MVSVSSSEKIWDSIAIIPDLDDSNLYVFRVNLPATAKLEHQCVEVLNEEERQRAFRFKKEGTRRHSLIGRGVLRCLLGRFLAIPPHDVALNLGPNGKPEANGLSFNVAHSGDVILIAVARTGMLGIDVERINPATPVLDIAERYFAPEEIAQIAANKSDEAQRTAFFRLWTRKEAIIKADGRGLSVGLSSFAADDLAIVPDTSAVRKTFRVHSLPTTHGYAAALATDQLSAEPRFFLYPDQ
jgi:4'-phosphopantetheinyl transferase